MQKLMRMIVPMPMKIPAMDGTLEPNPKKTERPAFVLPPKGVGQKWIFGPKTKGNAPSYAPRK